MRTFSEYINESVDPDKSAIGFYMTLEKIDKFNNINIVDIKRLKDIEKLGAKATPSGSIYIFKKTYKNIVSYSEDTGNFGDEFTAIAACEINGVLGSIKYRTQWKSDSYPYSFIVSTPEKTILSYSGKNFNDALKQLEKNLEVK
jgi:hypothetical protein